MTTSISSIYDAIVAKMAAAYPDAKRIPDPYNLDLAPGYVLRDGYGLTIGATGNPRQELTCQLSFDRAVGIVRTKLVATTDSNTTARADIEKVMYEDQLSLIKLFEADSTLGGVATDIEFNDDSGIEILDLDIGRYFVLISGYRVRYTENLIS